MAAKIIGKIGYDELSPDIVKDIKEGSVRVLNEKFKIDNSSGEYDVLGLGKTFTFPELMKAISDKITELNEMDTAVKKMVNDNYSQKIDQVNHQIVTLTEEINKLNTKIKDLTTKPPEEPHPEPPAGDHYSTDRSDYTVNSYRDKLGIAVEGNEIFIPTTDLISEDRFARTVRKGTDLDSYLDKNSEYISTLNSMNTAINTH